MASPDVYSTTMPGHRQMPLRPDEGRRSLDLWILAILVALVFAGGALLIAFRSDLAKLHQPPTEHHDTVSIQV